MLAGDTDRLALVQFKLPRGCILLPAYRPMPCAGLKRPSCINKSQKAPCLNKQDPFAFLLFPMTLDPRSSSASDLVVRAMHLSTQMKSEAIKVSTTEVIGSTMISDPHACMAMPRAWGALQNGAKNPSGPGARVSGVELVTVTTFLVSEFRVNLLYPWTRELLKC